MEDEEAAGVVALLHQVVGFFHLAEVELINKGLSDVGRQVAECEVRDQRVRYDFLVLGFLLPENVGELLEDKFLSVVLECT